MLNVILRRVLVNILIKALIMGKKASFFHAYKTGRHEFNFSSTNKL